MATATPSATLSRRILIGLAVGLLLGLGTRSVAVLVPAAEPMARWLGREVLEPLGLVFLRILFFVVVPLVFASLAQGVLQLGDLRRLAPLASRTFLLFGVNMAAGVILGLLMMNVLEPGRHLDDAVRAQLLADYGGDVSELSRRAAAQDSLSLRRLVEMLLPQNLIRSIADFQLLPLITFALMVGAAACALPGARRERVEGGMQDVVDLMTTIVHAAMRLAPYAVAALVASVVMAAGVQVLKALLVFVAGVLGAMAIHLFGTMSLLLRLFSRRQPRLFFRAIRTILVTAFSTSSSNATLPTTLQVTREELGVSASTAGFVLPLGATMNMSGTALYEGCVVLFVAQVYGVSLGLGQQVVLVLMAVLSAVAVAGVPGASLPLIVGLLANFGLPAEGVALILGFDRLLDMARTVLNVAADVATACIVDDALAATRSGSGTVRRGGG